MASRAIVVTLLLTVARAALMVLELGVGGVIYFFVVGPGFLPGALAMALPAGAFGGVLLTRAEDGDVADEDSTRETVRLAVLTVLLSMISVGWLVPLAYDETSRATAFFQGSRLPVEQPEVRPGSLTLDELLVEASRTPGAQHELLRRAGWIAASLVVPLFAGVLTTIRPRWRYDEAVAVTVAIYLISVALPIAPSS